MTTLSRTDLSILRILEADARISFAALAERVGLSKSPCWSRVQALEKQGVITVIIGEPMYAVGSGPRAIADLNDRVQSWNEQMQREMGSLPAAPAAPSANDQVAV